MDLTILINIKGFIELNLELEQILINELQILIEDQLDMELDNDLYHVIYNKIRN
jgi:hypothetical protein